MSFICKSLNILGLYYCQQALNSKNVITKVELLREIRDIRWDSKNRDIRWEVVPYASVIVEDKMKQKIRYFMQYADCYLSAILTGNFEIVIKEYVIIRESMDLENCLC